MVFSSSTSFWLRCSNFWHLKHQVGVPVVFLNYNLFKVSWESIIFALNLSTYKYYSVVSLLKFEVPFSGIFLGFHLLISHTDQNYIIFSVESTNYFSNMQYSLFLSAGVRVILLEFIFSCKFFFFSKNKICVLALNPTIFLQWWS